MAALKAVNEPRTTSIWSTETRIMAGYSHVTRADVVSQPRLPLVSSEKNSTGGHFELSSFWHSSYFQVWNKRNLNYGRWWRKINYWTNCWSVQLVRVKYSTASSSLHDSQRKRTQRKATSWLKSWSLIQPTLFEYFKKASSFPPRHWSNGMGRGGADNFSTTGTRRPLFFFWENYSRLMRSECFISTASLKRIPV